MASKVMQMQNSYSNADNRLCNYLITVNTHEKVDNNDY